MEQEKAVVADNALQKDKEEMEAWNKELRLLFAE